MTQTTGRFHIGHNTFFCFGQTIQKEYIQQLNSIAKKSSMPDASFLLKTMNQGTQSIRKTCPGLPLNFYCIFEFSFHPLYNSFVCLDSECCLTQALSSFKSISGLFCQNKKPTQAIQLAGFEESY